MNVTTPFKRLPIVAKSLGIGLFLVSSLFAATQPKKMKYDTLIYVPVTFYDYHPDGKFGFEQCMGTNSVTRGMVQDTIFKTDRKPLRTESACNTTTPATYPCACALNDWFRPAGYSTATNLKFEPVQTFYRNGNKIDTIMAHRWTGLVRNTAHSTATDTFWTLPGWDSTAAGANLVYYSYLPFRLIDPDKGTYEFNRTGANQFFWLDDKGFGNEPTNQTTTPKHNFGFTMELHQEFTYQGDNSQAFSFSGDDDVWVFINNKRILDLGGIHGEQPGSFNLNDSAKSFKLEVGKKYWLDVFYTERHTTQANCRITSNLLRPYLDTIILASAPNLCPGDTNIITATIFDKDSSEMTWLEDSIRWEIISPTPLDTNDKLINTKGKTTRFTATKAWRNIIVRASVYDPYLPDQKKYADAPFSINVCSPDHIVIEGSADPDHNVERPLEKVTITSEGKIYDKMYSIVRDKFGNLADTLTSAKWFTSPTATIWTSENTKIVTVQGETGAKYHGTATRADSAGPVKVTASDTSRNLKPGSVIVNVTTHYYVSLRLVDLKTGKVVDTLKIETDSTGHYKIQGLRSTFKDDPNNPNAWDDIQGKIDLKDTLKTDCALTVNDIKWDYCPHNHGTGRVILTNPNDTNTATTIIPVIVTLSKPKLYLDILTPAEKRIAGDTIQIIATIKNDDGLIPIPYCFGGDSAAIKDSIAYYDNLGRGGAQKPEPFTLVNDKVPFNFDFEKYHTGQCFQNGADTFGVVLYYAPYSDSSHVIRATAGSLEAETPKFKLLPGPLYSMKLENNSFVEYPDSILLDYNNEIFSANADGYDKYGNRKGFQEGASWSVTGTLDSSKLLRTTGTYSTYQTQNEKDGRRGDMVAQAKGINDSTIVASITIIVKTPKSDILKAITRDLNGNGVLDRIDITFHKQTKFTKDDGNLSIVNLNPNVSFSVDSIVPADVSGRNHYIYLSEADKSKPQTGWTPKMKLSNFPEAVDTTVTVEDGAAPVVWKATKTIASKRINDVISIVLSEKVSKGGGSNLVTVESDPPMVFKIWEKVNGTFVYEDSMLAKITNFDNIKDSANLSVLIFKMTNGNDITSDDWVNIFYQNNLIADEKSNYTQELNQRVPFFVNGDIVLFSVIPSPAVPTTKLTKPGEIRYVESKKQAAEDIKKAGGGTIFKFTLSNTSDSIRVDIKVKVYDVVGNQVASLPLMKNVKLLKNEETDSTLFSLLFEFGGVNEQGMKIAPGQYKAIAWINYSSKYKSLKMSKVFGIKKYDISKE
jgi:fibro-slime domain-containing protein